MNEVIDVEKELVIRQSPGFLKVDVEDFQEKVRVWLQDYRLVVTSDTLSDAKKAMATLNKLTAAVKAKRKEIVDIYGEPVEQFIQDMMSIEKELQAARDDIKVQADKCDEESKTAILEGIISYRDHLYHSLHVNEEFQTANVDDLAKLTAITQSGNDLTKATKTAVETRVKECRALQDRTNARLMELENICYKNGLKAPLTRAHVEPFLMEDDQQQYELQLNNLLSVEIERQQKIEAQANQNAIDNVAKTAAAINQAQQVDTSQEPQTEAAPAHNEPPQQPTNIPTPEPAKRTASKGNILYEVTCVFHLETPPGVDEVAIDQAARELLDKAGMGDKLSSVYVKRQEAVA